MMNKNLLNRNLIEDENVVVTVNSEGKTIEEAINNIFMKLRKDIYSNVDGYVVHMFPEKFILKDFEIEEKVEKFMFFFLPKKRFKYKLIAEVDVKVKLLKDIK